MSGQTPGEFIVTLLVGALLGALTIVCAFPELLR